MQGIGAGKAEHRMLYTALLYTPGKEHTRYLVDFDLDALAEQVRWQARALGIPQVSDLIAVTDGGNGLEEALQRHLAEDVTTILDWYHAAEHLCDFAKVWHADDEAARQRWQTEAKGILYEQGGEAMLRSLQALALPADASALVREELRKLIGYFTNNRHRTDYPSYRRKGWLWIRLCITSALHWNIVVDDHGDRRDIDTTGKNVGSNENLRSALSKVLNDAVAFGTLKSAVYSYDFMSVLCKARGNS
jgi:hypothetical protein